MEVRSNRIGDIRSHYRRLLSNIYTDKEADTLLFLVLMEYTGMTKAEILIKHEVSVSESQLLKIHFAVKDLLNEKPIQYVLGKTEFYGLPIIVNSKVLIPRPETEELVDLILHDLKYSGPVKILDIGTGSGCIAVTVKKKLPDTTITALDVSEFALEVAALNAEINDVVVDFVCHDILSSDSWKLEDKYDAIVSNPPYVRESEKAMMKKNVLEYEPDQALFVSDDNPLVFYDQIIQFANKYLIPGGNVYCEINQYLAEEVYTLFAQSGFVDIQIMKDYKGNFRFVQCSKEL